MESSYGTLFTLKGFYVLHEMSVCMELSKCTLYSPDFQLYLQINSNQISVYFCRCTCACACACACSSSYLAHARVHTSPPCSLFFSSPLFSQVLRSDFEFENFLQRFDVFKKGDAVWKGVGDWYVYFKGLI